MARARLLARVVICLGSALATSVTLAGAAYQPAYTPEQQKAAAEALKEGVATLDKLDGEIAAAYGGSRFKTLLGQDAQRVKGFFARFKHANDLARQDGQEIIQRASALSAVTQACAASGASVRALGALSTDTSDLLVRRGLATRQELQTWATPVASEKRSSAKGDEVLDCASVRTSLEGAMASLKAASAGIQAANAQQPEGVLVPRTG